MTRCGYCNTPADGTHLCTECTQTLRTALDRITDLWPDLLDAAGKRLNQTHGAHVSGTPETALPFNPRAADLKRQITDAVNRLVIAIITRTHQNAPTGNVPARAAWCEQRMFAARFIPSVAAHRGDLDYLAREMVQTVDKPNRRIPIPTPCPDCAGSLEAELRRPRVITCKDCRTEYDATRFLAAGWLRGRGPRGGLQPAHDPQRGEGRTADQSRAVGAVAGGSSRRCSARRREAFSVACVRPVSCCSTVHVIPDSMPCRIRSSRAERCACRRVSAARTARACFARSLTRGSMVSCSVMLTVPVL